MTRPSFEEASEARRRRLCSGGRYAGRSTPLVLRSYWELFLRPGNIPYTRQRDVRSHSIYDLNGGPVTVCSLLPEGSADGGCRSSDLGPDRGGLGLVRVYYRFVQALGVLLGKHMPALAAWSEQERAICARYAAV